MPNFNDLNMPEAITEIKAKRHRVYVAKGMHNSISADWFDAHFWQDQNAIVGQSVGRNTVYFIDFENRAMVFRRYYRGGLMAKLSKDRFLFAGYKSSRAAAEINMLAEMVSLGLPVPRPIAAIVKKTHWFSCENAILIERIKNTEDGYQSLVAGAWSTEIWRRLGKVIRQFHQAGVYHSDMNIHNILIDDTEKFWLIDFDKCDIRKVNLRWQQQTLQRLLRSLQKEKTKYKRFHFEQSDWLALMHGYQANV